VDVVSEYVKLEKRGKNYFGLCPFHKEKTPSFSVEEGKQIFYCFGCGKGGNVFQFISLAEKLDFIEAVRLLADRAKITLPESDDPREEERLKLKKLVLSINLVAARYFNNALNSKQGEAATAAYLRRRDLSEYTVRKFGIGYSFDKWDGLYKHLSSQGVSVEEMLKSGLVLKNESGNIYDRFRGRLMFPIFSIRGEVIGFGGRVLDDSLPKYMNSPETAAYNKRKHLYALNFAKNSESPGLIIVEGYMDVISLHQRGITNVVASLGTALTESQGRTLKKYAEEVIISYDADMAGQAATMRGLELLSDIGCKVRVLTVPDGKDPDDYIKKNGPDKFRRLVDNALPLVEYKIRVLKNEHDLDKTEGKIAFLNKAAGVMAKVDNVVEREMYIRKLSREYEISEEAMLSEVIRRKKPFARRQSLKLAKAVEASKKAASSTDRDEEKIISDERFILSLLSVDNSIYNVLEEHFKVDQYMGEANKKTAEVIYRRMDERKGITPAELLNIVTTENSGKFARILNEECHCDDNQKAIMGKIRDIEKLKLQSRRNKVLELLKNINDLPEEEAVKLKLELKNLTQEISLMNEKNFVKEGRD
jgi:DNA primase